MVHAVQKGDISPPSKEVAETAKTISKSDALDFAKTKHKGLPMKKEEKVAAVRRAANLVTNFTLLKQAGLLKHSMPMPPAPPPAPAPVAAAAGASAPIGAAGLVGRLRARAPAPAGDPPAQSEKKTL
jgi:hypothetical protein